MRLAAKLETASGEDGGHHAGEGGAKETLKRPH
jgi:hypothetical protein